MKGNSLADTDDRTKQHYQENKYPYVYPKGDLVISADDGILANLTPLEGVFVQWVLQVDDPEEAITSLMNPAYPFDRTVSNGQEIRLRPTVVDAINKFRKKFPYLSKYTADYTLGLIHEEMEYLRARNRRKRYNEQEFLDRMCNGKRSAHEEEIAEVQVLIDLLKLTKDLTTGQTPDGSFLPAAAPGDTDSGINRVLAEAQERILGRQAGDYGPLGNGPP